MSESTGKAPRKIDGAGMTLRQWYAGQAISCIANDSDYTNQYWPKNVAEDAVRLADALIAELDKKEDQS